MAQTTRKPSILNERRTQAISEGWTARGPEEGNRAAARIVIWLTKPDGSTRRIIGTCTRIISDEVFASELETA